MPVISILRLFEFGEVEVADKPTGGQPPLGSRPPTQCWHLHSVCNCNTMKYITGLLAFCHCQADSSHKILSETLVLPTLLNIFE